MTLKVPQSNPGAAVAGRRESPELRITQEGAIALGLSRLHRQTLHELRGPLNSISLNLALLGRAARGDLTGIDNAQERQEGWVQAIEEELERLTAAVERWSHLLADSDETPMRLDLRGTLGEVDMTLSPLASHLAVDLEIHRPEDGIHIEAPRLELRRLLTALTATSMEALGSEDRLRLEVRADEERAMIEAEVEKGSDGEEDRTEEGEGPLVSTLIAELATCFEDFGGCLEAAGRAGWRVSWPLSCHEDETTDADA